MRSGRRLEIRRPASLEPPVVKIVVGNRVFLVFHTVGDNPWFFATLSGGQQVFDNLGSNSNPCLSE
jgi:hypothetical protein